MQIPLKYKLTLGIVAGFAAFYLIGVGIGVPIGKYMEYRPEEYRATGFAGEPVAVYAKPSLNSKVIGTVNALTTAEVVARKKTEEGDDVNAWYKVSVNGGYGWVPQTKYNSYPENTSFGFGVRTSLTDYLMMVSRNGQGSEEFYMSVLKGYNAGNPIVHTEGVEIAAKELGRMGSKNAIPHLQAVCKRNGNPAFQQTLQALGGSTRQCVR